MVVEKVQLTIITRMSDDPIYTHQGLRNVWGHGGLSFPPETKSSGDHEFCSHEIWEPPVNNHQERQKMDIRVPPPIFGK